MSKLLSRAISSTPVVMSAALFLSALSQRRPGGECKHRCLIGLRAEGSVRCVDCGTCMSMES